MRASPGAAPWLRVAFAMFAVGWGANQFAPMLVVYRDELGLSPQTRALLFGVYAVGLIPGLLLGGGASDRLGRRRVVLPLVALSPLASVVLILGREEVAGLAAGRLLAGVCSGVVFSAASAWVRELSAADAPGTGARRAAIALSAGFGAGPLVAGLLGEWVGAPLWEPYLPHVVLGVVATVLLLPARDTAARRDPRARLVSVPAVCRSPRFLLGVAPMAPWVFGSASIAFALLPAEVAPDAGGAVALAGVLTGVSLGAGVAVQGWARRLEDGAAAPADPADPAAPATGETATGGPADGATPAGRRLLAGTIGLGLAAVGCGLGILAITLDSRLVLLPTGLVLGTAYGLCLVSGLRETERLAAPAEHGATVAIYYSLTYLGFAAPYVLGFVGDLVGGRGALAIAAAAALLCAAVVRVAPRA